MKVLPQDEINALAEKFILLKAKAEKSKSKKVQKEYKDYQNYCVEKLKFLVTFRSNKYKKFSNHLDLEQDGFEALILALKTYDPKKGCFSWWADQYIKTRITRAANSHSTIKYPLKKAKENKPYKMSELPVITDESPDASQILESHEINKDILQAIKKLPEQHQKVINMAFGFNGIKQHTITNVIKELSISRIQCLKILEEAKTKLKDLLILHK